MKTLKLYLVDSWIDDRTVLADERLKAGTLYTAAIHAARLTRSKNFKPGSRKQKLHIRVSFIGKIVEGTDQTVQPNPLGEKV